MSDGKMILVEGDSEAVRDAIRAKFGAAADLQGILDACLVSDNAGQQPPPRIEGRATTDVASADSGSSRDSSIKHDPR